MRMTFLAVAILALGGCAVPGGTKPPQSAKSSRTPVVRGLPSPSQKNTARRLSEGQEAVGKIDVEGPLVR